MTIIQLRLDAADGQQDHQDPEKNGGPLDLSEVTIVGGHDDLEFIHVASSVHADALSHKNHLHVKQTSWI